MDMGQTAAADQSSRLAWLPLGLAMIACAPTVASAQDAAAPTSGSARVDALVRRMTVEEKISLIHGALEAPDADQGQGGYWPGLAKYGIPPLRLADGPPGVLTRRPATAPPATMALAATFSRADAEANGAIIARSAKALGQQIVLQPFINIERDLSWVRAYNTFGEDPLVVGEIGAALVRGVQAQGVMAQAKHLIAFDGADDVVVGPQALHEIYLAPFASVVDAGVSSVMCSYNKINGPYACGSSEVMGKLLRKELGFKGFVTSDWGATHATDFVVKGLDLEMPGTGFSPTFLSATPPPDIRRAGAVTFGSGAPEEPPLRMPGGGRRQEKSTGVLDAMAQGSVKPADIDRAVGHILYEVERFGWLDHPPSLAQSPDPAAEAAPTLRKTASDAAVLLKNDGGILPLDPGRLKDVALIGPGAGQLIAVGQSGEKALGHVERQVSPLAALRAAAGADGSISYAVDNEMDGEAIPASALSNLVREGSGPEAMLDHTLKAGAALPPGTSAVWMGTLNVPESGRYRLHLQVIGAGATLAVDGAPGADTSALGLHGNVLQPGQDNVLPTTDGLDNARIERELSAGPHQIRVEIKGDDSGAPTQVRLAWVTPAQQAASHAAAIEAARRAKTAVVFAWHRNGPAFALPGDQDRLIEEVAAANPNTIVVLNVSKPIAMPWLNKVKAVLVMWWPGDEGGWATADVLTGSANPAGRLPFTWPARLSDNVANDPAHPERSAEGIGGKTSYSEGLLVGYRWFDAQKIQPLYPFGYGLSYTRFAYSGLKVTPRSGGAIAQLTVRNVGQKDGDEVIQLYLAAPNRPPSDGQFAPQSLVGFERVHLKAGEAKSVRVVLPARRFEYWSKTRNRWVRRAGPRSIAAGASSRDLRVTATFGP